MNEKVAGNSKGVKTKKLPETRKKGESERNVNSNTKHNTNLELKSKKHFFHPEDGYRFVYEMLITITLLRREKVDSK